MAETDDGDERAAPADASASAQTFSRRLKDAWEKTVGNFATDDKGTESLLSRLVDFGHLSTEEAKRVLADARHKIEENKRELDHRVDESVKKTVGALFDPSPRELKRLEDKVSELEGRLQRIETRG